MTLLHLGLTIEIPNDDPRVGQIEALLFGRALSPPPTPSVPEPPAPPPSEPPAPVPVPVPTPPPAPPVVVPEDVRRAWTKLTPSDRRELLELTAGPRTPPEMERLLGLTHKKLLGQHSRISRVAFGAGVPLYILSSGRGRSHRRFRVRADMAPFIRALAAEEPVAPPG